MTRQLATDEVEVREHVEKIIAGIRDKDLAALERLYAQDVVSFDVEPPLQHVGVAAKMRNWAAVFRIFEDVTYELRDVTVTVGGDIAFGHGFGRLSGTLKDGTATNGMWVRATYCLRKIDNSWVIVHDQASVPLDWASGKAVTDLEP